MNYSPSKNAFYPEELKDTYVSAGTWPDDIVEVSEEVASEFMGEAPTGKARGASSKGLPIWVDVVAEAVEVRLARANKAIDKAAGSARQRFVSAGEFIQEEYRQALDAVNQWRAAGSPADNVPEDITSGAEYSGITNEEAAQEIELTASQWASILTRIRVLRLTGKKAVNEASDEDIESVASSFIKQLNELMSS